MCTLVDSLIEEGMEKGISQGIAQTRYRDLAALIRSGIPMSRPPGCWSFHKRNWKDFINGPPCSNPSRQIYSVGVSRKKLAVVAKQ